MSSGAIALTIAVAVVVLFLPGLLAGLASGLRGWVLVGTAPLLTYAIGGLAGPWLARAGVGFTIYTFALATAVLVGAALLVRTLSKRMRARAGTGYEPPEPLWSARAQLAVIACVLIGAAVGLYTVLRGMGELDAIAQDWDAAFHANGIRYLDETADSSLTGMSGVNKYGDGVALFYPNAYHLIAVVVYQLVHPLAGVPIPAVLNANTVLLPGLLALSLVAVVREFRGRAVLAGTVALVVVAPVTLLYSSMDRGPLLPFLLGLALLPLGAVALHNFLTRKGLDTGFLFALAALGLLTIHTSTLFTGILFALPMLVQRWATAGGRSGNAAAPGKLGAAGRARMIGMDVAGLAAVAAASALVAAPQLLGALDRPTGGSPMVWPADFDIQSAVGALVVFQHDQAHPQLWPAVALALGVVFLGRLNGLRWIAGTALLASLGWIAVATSNAELVVDLSQPWWNDPWRFMAMAALPLTFLAAHGLAETQAWLRDKVYGVAGATSARVREGVAAGIAIAVLLGFVGATQVLYTESNSATVRAGYGTAAKLRVSQDEAAAMLELGKLAGPGEWAMNDRWDGTVWTYAISGVRTVAAHYDSMRLPSAAQLLGEHFREYPTNRAVRDAVERLNIRWVIIGKRGFIRQKQRSPGLEGYDKLPFLTKVYDNPGAAIYRIDR